MNKPLFTYLLLVYLPVMAEEASRLETIEVTSFAQPLTDQPETAFSRQIIERKDFSQSAVTLEQVLQTQTGTSLRSIGGDGSYSQISLRGNSAHQVMIYLDGILLNGANGGAVDLSTLPLDAIERIEIYPQQAPLTFGQQTQGGVINLVSRRNHHKSFTQVKTGIGSFGEKKLAFTQQQNHPNWSHLIQLRHQQAQNDFEFENDMSTPLNPYDDQKQTRQNAQTEQQNALLKLDWQVNSNQTLYNQLWVNQQTQHLPNQQNEADNHAQLSKQQWHWKSGIQSQNLANSAWQNKLDLSLQQTEEHYLDPDSHIGLGKQQNDYFTQGIQLQNYGEYPLIQTQSDWLLKTQFTYLWQNYRSFERLPTLFSGNSSIERQRQTLAVGLEAPYISADEHWTWIPSLQWQHLKDDNLQTDSHTDDLNEQDLTYQLGGIYAFNRHHQIKASLATAIRQPNFYEKYSDRGLMIGNPELQKESSTLAEISYQYQKNLAKKAENHQAWLKKIAFKLNAYQNQVKNIIIQSYDARGIGRSENMDSAEIWGIESEAHFTNWQGTELTLNASRLQSLMHSNYSAYDLNRLPNFPEWQANISLKQGYGHWQAEYQFHFEQGSFYDRANLLPVATKRLHQAGLKYQSKQWGMTFEAKNLLNSNDETFNGYPAPGRSYHLTLQIQSQ